MDVISMGEMLIDFTPGKEKNSYIKNPGGAPANLAVSMARNGLEVGFLGKLIGRKGDFYRIAGYKASSIDGPTPNTLPPYNRYVVLGPENPDKIARQISESVKAEVAIVDINDLGGNILGTSRETMDRKGLLGILKDNPLGQCSEQTPIGIIRRLED